MGNHICAFRIFTALGVCSAYLSCLPFVLHSRPVLRITNDMVSRDLTRDLDTASDMFALNITMSDRAVEGG